MSVIDSDGVPVLDPTGDYSGAGGGSTGSTSGSGGTTTTAMAPRRKLWPLALLALPLLAAGAYFATRGGQEEESESETPITSNIAVRPSPVLPVAAGKTSKPPVSPSSKVAAKTMKAPVAPSKAKPQTVTLQGVPMLRNARGEMLGMRRTLEADGWTVHWLAKQHEVRAWKPMSADRKMWAEMRITPQGQSATSFRKGPKGKILKQERLTVAPHALVQQGRVLVPSPFLQHATDGRLRVGRDGKPTLVRSASSSTH